MGSDDILRKTVSLQGWWRMSAMKEKETGPLNLKGSPCSLKFRFKFSGEQQLGCEWLIRAWRSYKDLKCPISYWTL